MGSANVLDDSGEQYEYVPEMISPISDSPCNPDSIRMRNMEPGTVKTVCAFPELETLDDVQKGY